MSKTTKTEDIFSESMIIFSIQNELSPNPVVCLWGLKREIKKIKVELDRMGVNHLNAEASGLLTGLAGVQINLTDFELLKAECPLLYLCVN